VDHGRFRRLASGRRTAAAGRPPAAAAWLILLMAACSGGDGGAASGTARGGDPAAPGATAAAAAVPAAHPGGATDGYAAMLRQVMPSVVNISSVQVITTYEYSPFLADPFFRYYFGDRLGEFVVPHEQRRTSLGSGVVVNDGRTVLTNYHVVEQAREVRVTAMDGHTLAARIAGTDERTDLAVLKLDDETLPAARLGDSEALQVGDIVLAIGSPFGLGNTVTMGIVSAIGRGSLGIADYEDFIQTDAAINPGNSGGALVNTRGEVVGINTAIFSRTGGYQGIGFAIPSNMARGVLDGILEHGRVVRGYAGIYLQPLTPEMAEAFGLQGTRGGAVVAAVEPGSPAARAGLRRGDVVLAFRGRPVGSVNELRTQMSRLGPGETARLEVARAGRRLEIDLALGEPPRPPQRPPQRPRRRG
jgi:Do/DeqQ family serine protease